MKTVTAPTPATRPVRFGLLFGLLLTGLVHAADPAPELPTGRFLVADSEGISSINTGTKIEPLAAKSAYAAQGATVETQSNARLGVVLSNGTGLAFTPDTNLLITRFQQDRFAPNRTDLDAEPSMSHFDALLARGGLGISCTKFSAGSTMSVKTRHGSIIIQGGKLFIEATDTQTTVSLVEGRLTIRDDLKGVGVPLQVGQQAIITRQAQTLQAMIKLVTLAERDLQLIKDPVDLSTMARRTVYFDVVKPGVPGEERLIPVRVLPGTIPGPNTVSPFRITRTVVR